MENTASLRADNANLRKIQSKLVQWELKENPLAPLSAAQTDFINRLTDLASGNVASTTGASSTEEKSDEASEELPSSLEKFKQSACVIDSTQNFLSWYNSIDAEILEHFDDVYLEYYEQLRSRAGECDQMLKEIDVSLESLGKLTQEFNFVSEKTSSLHEASESLLQDQTKLSDTGEEIRKRLKYFTQAESISQRLHNPTFSVSNDTFVDILNTIDDCIEYMRVNPTFSEASAYSVKYRTCLAKATQMMKAYVTGILTNATAQVMAPKGSGAPKSLEVLDQPKVGDRSAEAAFALFYGKFQASSARVKWITATIEERLDRSPDYEHLLGELHSNYLTQRAAIMSSGVDQAIKDLAKKHKGDHCALVRSACAFMVHICQDEHRLFYQFFAKPSGQLIGYMEGLCTILYDTLRPYIIRIDHLETLAEICSILKVEMLDEHVTYSPDSLEAFAKIVYQLLQDVQERIGFRAQNYLESDIRNYRPSAGDLAYPEKLEMMESIALSLQDNSHHFHHNPQHLRRADSRSSITSGVSMDTSLDTTASTAEHTMKVRSGNSPADMHGMWYPTVRRTLVCLSRLYRCIDKSIFQSLSQQALAHCIHSVSFAAAQIAQSRTTIDGELFEIKHLLILREQIAPFRVDFTAKETSLDFSKVRTAAYELLQKRKQLFSLGSNNALLEFLLDGTPQVREQLLDSRKDVDRQLKTVCETFIRDATRQLVGAVLTFIEAAQNYLKNQPTGGKATTTGVAAVAGAGGKSTGMALRMAPFAAPQQISSIIQECLRNIKSKLARLQRSMQLYLANKDTEFILFRPIRNNIIGAFVKLEQILLLNAYTKDDLTIVSCPSGEQVSVLLSSVNLTGSGTGESTVPAFGRTQTTDAQRKISTSSIGSGAGASTKAPVEKKVSFDSGANTVVEIERIEHITATDVETEVENGQEVLVESLEGTVQGGNVADIKSIEGETERA